MVAHKVGALSAWLIRRMKLIPYVSLINIAAKREILPELMQERCTIDRIVQELVCLAEPDMVREQRQQCLGALRILRGSAVVSPHDAAAAAVLSCAHEDHLRM